MLGVASPAPRASSRYFPPELERAFDFIVFDWDGTAVANRSEEASELRALVEALLRRGIVVGIVTGTSFDNLNRQFLHAIRGPHKRRLWVSTHRGSEGWTFRPGSSAITTMRRTATIEEDRALTDIGDALADTLRQRFGLATKVVHDRLNRRKVDLIPEPAWADPPKSELPALTSAVEARLHQAGIHGGLSEIVAMAERLAKERGLANPRITTDAKHIEIGLTDKGDALRWILTEVIAHTGEGLDRLLVVGDELGPVGGVPGSDSRMMIPEAGGATFVSVGPEPSGVPTSVIHLEGGPLAFRALLKKQLALHETGASALRSALWLELPLRPTKNAASTIVERGFELAREHEIEALFTVANGRVGVRGALFEGSSLSAPAMFVAGHFAPNATTQIPELVALPDAMRLHLVVDGQELSLERLGGRNRRILDLRQGALFREFRPRTPDGRLTRIVELRLASLADRDFLLQVLAFVPENYSGVLHLEARTPGPRFEQGRLALVGSSFLTSETGELLARTVEALEEGAVERWIVPLEIGKVWLLHRILCLQSQRGAEPPLEAAEHRIRHIEPWTSNEIALRHRDAWNDRWATADIVVEGDEEAERALRFASYHLISSADPDNPRVSIGARGLTGKAYAGHVFWDTDIFMLPYFTLTYPKAARALLGYRHRSLDAARLRARERGYEGALFAWESASTGEDVTPRLASAPDGGVVAIRSGELEHHISADVAYGVWFYWRATRDRDFLLDEGAEILVETARFWASRGQVRADGSFHIDNVVGPDEYHEGVDDNAYTNGLAAWNLARAADVVDWLRHRMGERGEEKLKAMGLREGEGAHWKRLSTATHLGFDPRSLLIEQFRGYDALEDLDFRSAYADPSLPIDVVLGRERVQKTKVGKQADVLMLLYLLEGQFSYDVALANFHHYEPRTAHGSSLSPGIHAALAARLGLVDIAERYFRETARIDLDDLMGNAASGVHLGALASLWQAAIFGCAGLRVGFEKIELDPHLLPSFRNLAFSILWQQATVRIRIDAAPLRIEVAAEGEAPVRVGLRSGKEARIEPGRPQAIVRRSAGFTDWEEA